MAGNPELGQLRPDEMGGDQRRTMDVILVIVAAELSDRASMYLCLTFFLLYTLYYLLCVGKRPEIACGDERLRCFLAQHCPISRETYWPTWWCFEARAQTMVRVLLQSTVPVAYTQEYIKTHDGGEILLDWLDDSTSTYPDDVRPTVLFLPGLTGHSHEKYMLHLVSDAQLMGYRSVVFNNRGTGNSSLKTPRTFCAANTEDTKFVVSHVRQRFPQAPLVAVGVSLGGILLINYLAAVGSQTDLLAAVIFSPAYDLQLSNSSLETPLNYCLFNRFLARSLCQIFKRNMAIFEKHLDIDATHVLQSTSIKDFDDRLTVKLFGFESADHYYTQASLQTKLQSLAKPVFCISAADDPFAPEYSIPTSLAENHKNIAIIKTSHGGHIGFLEGTFPRHGNYLNKWFRQLVSAIFQHGFTAQ